MEQEIANQLKDFETWKSASELPVNEFRASNETITEVIVPKFAAITLRQHPGEYQSTTGISGDGHRKHNQE